VIDLKPACEQMIELLGRVTDDQLPGPTPCDEYTLGALVDHVDQGSVRFAAVARRLEAGAGPDPSAERLGPGWRDSIAQDVRALGAAWDDPTAWEGSSDVGGLELSNELWGKIALTELVVHAWDVARATGQVVRLPDETLRACFEHVRVFVPRAPVPEIWGRAVDLDAGATLLDRIVAITGRDPG